MVVVLHTCLVLSLPLKMWINVFRNLIDNEARECYGIKSSPNLQAVLFTTDVRIALITLRWIERIPDVFSANFSFILRGVPEGSHNSPTSRPSISETSIQSRPCCPFVLILGVLHGLNKQQEQSLSLLALKMNGQPVFIFFPLEMKWLPWLFFLPGHLQHSHYGRPCWPVNIKRGWWRSVVN